MNFFRKKRLLKCDAKLAAPKIFAPPRFAHPANLARRFRRVLLVFALILLRVHSAFSQEIVAPGEKILEIGKPVQTLLWNQNDTIFVARGESDPIIVRDIRLPKNPLYTIPSSRGMNPQYFGDKENGDMILGVSPSSAIIWRLPQGKDEVLTSPFNQEQSDLKISAATYTPAGGIVAIAYADGSITIHPGVNGGKKIGGPAPIDKQTQNIHNLAFNSDFSRVAAASSDGAVLIWNKNDSMSYSLISKIATFKGMQTPVVFSADSKSLYACKQENVVSRMWIDGTVWNEIRANGVVRNFTVTPDEKTLVVLTDAGRLEFYYMLEKGGRYLGYIAMKNNSEIISYAFNSNYSQVLIGLRDGSVYKLRVADVLNKREDFSQDMSIKDDKRYKDIYTFDADKKMNLTEKNNVKKSATETNAKTATRKNTVGTETTLPAQNENNTAAPQGQPAYVPFDFQPALRQRFSAFNVGASAIMLDKKSTSYQFGTAAEFGWYTTMFTAPVYEGLGARFAMAFPADNFPSTYKTLDGSGRIAPPYLFFGEVFVPVGVEVPVSTFVSLFSEVAFEAKVSWLMNPGVTSSKQAFSLGGRIRTGIIISKAAVMLGAEYDSMWGFIPEISVMANFKLKGKNKGGKQ